MKADEVRALRPGDRVFHWWDTGAFGATQMPMTVVRVNRTTVTVRADNSGEVRRVPFEAIDGCVDWEQS